MSTMLLKPDETPTIYADVDGTLVFWRADDHKDPGEYPFHKSGIRMDINQPLVDRLKLFYRPGKTCLVVWSRAGADHAKRVCQQIGLVADAYLPKPRICIDDKNHTITAHDKRGFSVLDPTWDLDIQRIPIAW